MSDRPSTPQRPTATGHGDVRPRRQLRDRCDDILALMDEALTTEAGRA
jgi:hypothetical protein